MEVIVEIAGMKISNQPGDIITTYALGSCLGITIYDPVARVGGMLHVMLPNSRINPGLAENNPFMFVDTGTPLFFREAYASGADKRRLVVKVAGGASIGNNKNDFFAIGKRNFVMLRKLFWKNGIMIDSHDVGENIARTMCMDVSTGRTWLRSGGREWEL